MSETTDRVQFDTYGPERFPSHLPFGERGYLFTVPGTFPEDTPSFTNVTNWEMAVYRTRPAGSWEVRDVNGNRRVWADADTRREAVGMAFHEIARVRRASAAEIAERRVAALGLEPVPPYLVETTSRKTFVLTPELMGLLSGDEDAEPGPAGYFVYDLATGQYRCVSPDGQVGLHSVQAGVFHARCGCDPADAAQFETEQAALVYAREALNVVWACPKIPAAADAPATLIAPAAPAATDDQPAGTDPVTDGLHDDFEGACGDVRESRRASLDAAAAYTARLLRVHLPTAATIAVDVTDGELRTVLDSDRAAVWHAPVSPVGLPDEIAEQVGDVMRAVLAFGADETALEDAGWTNPSPFDDTYDLALPGVPAQQ